MGAELTVIIDVFGSVFQSKAKSLLIPSVIMLRRRSRAMLTVGFGYFNEYLVVDLLCETKFCNSFKV